MRLLNLAHCRMLRMSLPFFGRVGKTLFCNSPSRSPLLACRERTCLPKTRSFYRLLPCVWPLLPPADEWGYWTKGPHTWPEKYPQAGGLHQSPVDIATASVQSKSFERPLRWTYGGVSELEVAKTVVNTGCGWRVDAHHTGSEVSGGPLGDDTYELVQFHCHWGHENHHGSEHTIDGKAYAGELHFVHWNKHKFSTCAEAVQEPQGLTVIAVFLEVGEKNEEVDKLCEVIPKIVLKDERIGLKSDVSPMAMFPANYGYWTYSGSLTTPPCYESVTWIVFKDYITVSEEQLQCFRQMKKACEDGHSDCVVLNTRPAQPINGRVIFESSA